GASRFSVRRGAKPACSVGATPSSAAPRPAARPPSPPRCRLRSRTLLWQILMLSAAIAVGCRGADDTTTVPGEAIESLRGRILGEVGNLVVPGRGWTRRLSGRWVYEGRQAELWVRIVEPVTMPTTLRFRLPQAWGLDATWDGRAIDLAGVGGGLRELTLPAADLTPGLHLLRMLPIDATGAQGAQSI